MAQAQNCSQKGFQKKGIF